MPSTILSDNGASSGTAGIKTTGSNDGQLVLQTTTAGGAATTAVTIDTSQNVGIGTSSPTPVNGGKVTQITNSGSAGTTADNQDLIVQSTNRYGAIVILGKNDKGSNLYFGDGDSSTIGSLQYDHTNNYLATYVNGSERARITSAGEFLVATTAGGSAMIYTEAPASKHAIRGNAQTGAYVGIYGTHSSNSANGYAAYFNNTGSSTGLYISNTAAWQSISDSRLKKDVQDLDTTARLMQLRPVDYLWKNQEESDEPTKRNFGFIAQEVQQVFPELVSVSPNEMLGVEYTGLIAPLVKAIQELNAKVEAQAAEIAALKGAQNG